MATLEQALEHIRRRLEHFGNNSEIYRLQDMQQYDPSEALDYYVAHLEHPIWSYRGRMPPPEENRGRPSLRGGGLATIRRLAAQRGDAPEDVASMARQLMLTGDPALALALQDRMEEAGIANETSYRELTGLSERLADYWHDYRMAVNAFLDPADPANAEDVPWVHIGQDEYDDLQAHNASIEQIYGPDVHQLSHGGEPARFATQEQIAEIQNRTNFTNEWHPVWWMHPNEDPHHLENKYYDHLTNLLANTDGFADAYAQDKVRDLIAWADPQDALELAEWAESNGNASLAEHLRSQLAPDLEQAWTRMPAELGDSDRQVQQVADTGFGSLDHVRDARNALYLHENVAAEVMGKQPRYQPSSPSQHAIWDAANRNREGVSDTASSMGQQALGGDAFSAQTLADIGQEEGWLDDNEVNDLLNRREVGPVHFSADSFLDALSQAGPTDQQWLIYADYLEEQGDVEQAEAIRKAHGEHDHWKQQLLGAMDGMQGFSQSVPHPPGPSDLGPFDDFLLQAPWYTPRHGPGTAPHEVVGDYRNYLHGLYDWAQENQSPLLDHWQGPQEPEPPAEQYEQGPKVRLATEEQWDEINSRKGEVPPGADAVWRNTHGVWHQPTDRGTQWGYNIANYLRSLLTGEHSTKIDDGAKILVRDALLRGDAGDILVLADLMEEQYGHDGAADRMRAFVDEALPGSWEKLINRLQQIDSDTEAGLRPWDVGKNATNYHRLHEQVTAEVLGEEPRKFDRQHESNVREKIDSFEKAYQDHNSENAQRLLQMVQQNLQKTGLNGKTHSGISEWAGGATPTVFHAVQAPPSHDSLQYAGAWYALQGNRHGALAFHPHEGGPDSVYTFTASGKSADEVRQALDEAGIAERVLIPTHQGHHVIIHDPGTRFAEQISTLGDLSHAPIHWHQGTAAHVGGDARNTGRADARETVQAYEATGKARQARQGAHADGIHLGRGSEKVKMAARRDWAGYSDWHPALQGVYQQTLVPGSGEPNHWLNSRLWNLNTLASRANDREPPLPPSHPGYSEDAVTLAQQFLLGDVGALVPLQDALRETGVTEQHWLDLDRLQTLHDNVREWVPELGQQDGPEQMARQEQPAQFATQEQWDDIWQRAGHSEISQGYHPALNHIYGTVPNRNTLNRVNALLQGEDEGLKNLVRRALVRAGVEDWSILGDYLEEVAGNSELAEEVRGFGAGSLSEAWGRLHDSMGVLDNYQSEAFPGQADHNKNVSNYRRLHEQVISEVLGEKPRELSRRNQPVRFASDEQMQWLYGQLYGDEPGSAPEGGWSPLGVMHPTFNHAYPGGLDPLKDWLGAPGQDREGLSEDLVQVARQLWLTANPELVPLLKDLAWEAGLVQDPEYELGHLDSGLIDWDWDRRDLEGTGEADAERNQAYQALVDQIYGAREQDEDDQPQQFARQAPPGGALVRGIFYPGGKMLPDFGQADQSRREMGEQPVQMGAEDEQDRERQHQAWVQHLRHGQPTNDDWLIYADWLEETGDLPNAETVRRIINHNRNNNPEQLSKSDSDGPVQMADGFQEDWTLDSIHPDLRSLWDARDNYDDAGQQWLAQRLHRLVELAQGGYAPDSNYARLEGTVGTNHPQMRAMAQQALAGDVDAIHAMLEYMESDEGQDLHLWDETEHFRLPHLAHQMRGHLQPQLPEAIDVGLEQPQERSPSANTDRTVNLGPWWKQWQGEEEQPERFATEEQWDEIWNRQGIHPQAHWLTTRHPAWEEMPIHDSDGQRRGSAIADLAFIQDEPDIPDNVKALARRALLRADPGELGILADYLEENLPDASYWADLLRLVAAEDLPQAWGELRAGIANDEIDAGRAGEEESGWLKDLTNSKRLHEQVAAEVLGEEPRQFSASPQGLDYQQVQQALRSVDFDVDLLLVRYPWLRQLLDRDPKLRELLFGTGPAQPMMRFAAGEGGQPLGITPLDVWRVIVAENPTQYAQANPYSVNTKAYPERYGDWIHSVHPKAHHALNNQYWAQEALSLLHNAAGGRLGQQFEQQAREAIHTGSAVAALSLADRLEEETSVPAEMLDYLRQWGQGLLEIEENERQNPEHYDWWWFINELAPEEPSWEWLTQWEGYSDDEANEAFDEYEQDLANHNERLEAWQNLEGKRAFSRTGQPARFARHKPYTKKAESFIRNRLVPQMQQAGDEAGADLANRFLAAPETGYFPFLQHVHENYADTPVSARSKRSLADALRSEVDHFSGPTGYRYGGSQGIHPAHIDDSNPWTGPGPRFRPLQPHEHPMGFADQQLHELQQAFWRNPQDTWAMLADKITEVEQERQPTPADFSYLERLREYAMGFDPGQAESVPEPLDVQGALADDLVPADAYATEDDLDWAAEYPEAMQEIDEGYYPEDDPWQGSAGGEVARFATEEQIEELIRRQDLQNWKPPVDINDFQERGIVPNYHHLWEHFHYDHLEDAFPREALATQDDYDRRYPIYVLEGLLGREDLDEGAKQLINHVLFLPREDELRILSELLHERGLGEESDLMQVYADSISSMEARRSGHQNWLDKGASGTLWGNNLPPERTDWFKSRANDTRLQEQVTAEVLGEKPREFQKGGNW